MDIQQIDKSIKQMRQMFGFMTAVFGLFAVLMLLALVKNAEAAGWLVLYILLAVQFSKGYSGASKRDPKGYKSVKYSSWVFVFLFPVLTIFGISYLNKLSKPEVKQAFGITNS